MIKKTIDGKEYNIGLPKKYFYLPPKMYSSDPNLVLAINSNSVRGNKVFDLSGKGNNGVNKYYQLKNNKIKSTFNESSIILDVPINIGTEFTFLFRGKLEDTTLSEIFLSYGFDIGANYELSFGNNPKTFYLKTPSGIVLNRPFEYRGIEITFTFRFKNGRNDIFVNGYLVSSGTEMISDFYLGNIGRELINRGFREYLIDYKVYNKFLTDQEILKYHNKFANQLTYKEDFSDYPVGQKSLDGWYPTTGGYEIKESDGSDGLKPGKKYLEWTTNDLKYISQEQAHGTWYFGGLKVTAFSEIEFISDDKFVNTAGSISLYFAYDSPNNPYLILRDVQSLELFNTTGVLSFSPDVRYDFLIQRLSSVGKFPILGDNVEYPANTFCVFYRETGNKDWSLVPISSGSNPVTRNNVTTSKYMLFNLQSGGSISEIKINQGVPQ